MVLSATKSYYHLITRSRDKLKIEIKIQIFILQDSRNIKLGLVETFIDTRSHYIILSTPQRFIPSGSYLDERKRLPVHENFKPFEI